ncbi:hypothetical protein PF008_g32222 [Phytophthora fragariae]|uniref:Uncharacterized protein n=1 Tax=Phytophthora fragariae TaxID=53985 RepID=A0A6G0Q0G7_9STRA|nr:hypothetical protein PF008_g32222 [Phytophthora fragariae]
MEQALPPRKRGANRDQAGGRTAISAVSKKQRRGAQALAATARRSVDNGGQPGDSSSESREGKRRHSDGVMC